MIGWICCAICNEMKWNFDRQIKIKKVERSHIKFEIPIYLVNSAHTSHKGTSYEESNTYEVVCEACRQNKKAAFCEKVVQKNSVVSERLRQCEELQKEVTLYRKFCNNETFEVFAKAKDIANDLQQNLLKPTQELKLQIRQSLEDLFLRQMKRYKTDLASAINELVFMNKERLQKLNEIKCRHIEEISSVHKQWSSLLTPEQQSTYESMFKLNICETQKDLALLEKAKLGLLKIADPDFSRDRQQIIPLQFQQQKLVNSSWLSYK